MIGRPFRIATLFGIPVKIDLSWIFIVTLLTWTLAAGVFAEDYPQLGQAARLAMGLASAILLFASILAHELSHSLVALRHRIPIRGITLFIFGGAAEMGEEPPSATSELKVALAGPAMSLALAATFGAVYTVGGNDLPASAQGVVKYLALMNGILVAFNVIPGFPLDGGRVFRAVLWEIWGNFRLATRAASAVGSGFGGLLIFLGLVSALLGNIIGGIWYAFIGLFLRNAARMSYQQVLMRDLLRGITARDLMSREVVAVSSGSTLQEIVDRILLPSGLTQFPVVEGGRLLGLLSLRDIKATPRLRWGEVTAAQAMRPRSYVAVSPGEEASRVLSLMAGDESAVIPVVEEERLVGLLSRPDLMRRLNLRLELAE